MTTIHQAAFRFADQCYAAAVEHAAVSVKSIDAHQDEDGRHVVAELSTGHLIGATWDTGPEAFDRAQAELGFAAAAGIALGCGSIRRESTV